MARKKYTEVELETMKDMARNLKEVLRRRGMSQKELSEKTNIPQSTVSDYTNARTLMSQGNLQIISDALAVNKSEIDSSLSEYAAPANFVKVPIVGTVMAGPNGIAYDERMGYERTDEDDVRGGKYFYLKVKGDSMVNDGILSGDLALVRETPEVESGELAVVVVNGEEGTIKRVYFADGSIILQASNPAYPPRVFAGKDKEVVRIVGKVKQTVRKY